MSSSRRRSMSYSDEMSMASHDSKINPRLLIRNRLVRLALSFECKPQARLGLYPLAGVLPLYRKCKTWMEMLNIECLNCYIALCISLTLICNMILKQIIGNAILLTIILSTDILFINFINVGLSWVLLCWFECGQDKALLACVMCLMVK
jgi:hypothetical protein